MKLYRWYIKAMDCHISLLLVSDLSQKHEHKKSLIIPGEQGRAGDVPYIIVKRKNRFFILIQFHLQPAATASTMNEFRKLIFIILIKKRLGKSGCVPSHLGKMKKKNSFLLGKEIFFHRKLALNSVAYRNYCRLNWYRTASFLRLLFFIITQSMIHIFT